jgi:hypothetical protein
MKQNIRLLALLVAACALLAAPAVGNAHHKPGHTKGPKSGQPNSKRCKKPESKVGFVVRGTLTNLVADDPATQAGDASVTITVTGANRHARNSGELVDTDTTAPGTQVQGGPYTVTGTADPFKVRLVDFEAGENPGTGDSVKIIGKVARTKAKCAAPDATLPDRYGDVNIRKVVIHDAD